jgi:Predicted periplasmic ligand-binding sensor domain
MIQAASIDQQSFRKLLSRNIGLPLGVGLLGAVAFVAVINYLLSAMQWVEHTDRVIGNANETVKLSIDMETGMRGFLITGDERFLDPYEVAKPKILGSLQSLRAMVEDNPQQVDRIDRLMALQQAWNDFGNQMITLRRNQGDYQASIGNGRGKRITDEIRKEFDGLISTEQQLRMARNEKVSSVTVTAISVFVLLIVGLSALLAYLGRRDLLALSSSYAENLEAQRRAAERLEHQAWLRNGQTQLAQQVLGQLTLPMLGDNILRFFAAALGSVARRRWAAWSARCMCAMSMAAWCAWPAMA